MLDKCFVERGEERHAPQMIVERALPIFFFQIGLERRSFKRRHLHFGGCFGRLGDLPIADQHVKNDAQHFHHDTRLTRLHRGGARLVGSAGHLAKELARTKLRQRSIDRKVDISVDADEFPLVRFRSMIGRIVRQETLHSFETAAKESNHRISAQVGERIMNKYVDCARYDVVSGRTELAFFANNLIFPIAVKNCRAFSPVFQLRPWNFF